MALGWGATALPAWRAGVASASSPHTHPFRYEGTPHPCAPPPAPPAAAAHSTATPPAGRAGGGPTAGRHTCTNWPTAPRDKAGRACIMNPCNGLSTAAARQACSKHTACACMPACFRPPVPYLQCHCPAAQLQLRHHRPAPHDGVLSLADLLPVARKQLHGACTAPHRTAGGFLGVRFRF